jgi:hypothetical protein
MTRGWRRALLGGAVGGAAWAAACTQVSTDPDRVLSLQLDPPALPSIVLLDSLHAIGGTVDSLHATAYNAQGAPVPTAPIRYLAIIGHGFDSAGIIVHRKIVVDPVTGHVVGVDTGAASVLATSGNLQTLTQALTVVLSPDSLVPLDSTHRVLDYNQEATLRDTLMPLPVRLLHIATPDTVGVTPYRLDYAWVPPPVNTNLDYTMVQIVNSGRKPQLVDTTVAGGASTLALYATLLAAHVQETVYVDVTATRPDGTPVPGSPVRFMIELTIH